MSVPEDRYPNKLYSQEWNIKRCRGRQRKTWGRVVDYLDNSECLQEVEGRDISAASFIASLEECISDRKCELYDEPLNSKVMLAL